MSPNLFKEKIFPLMEGNESLFVILVDNLRYDQWKAIQPILEEFFRVEKEEIYYSILPSTTQYARNCNICRPYATGNRAEISQILDIRRR